MKSFSFVIACIAVLVVYPCGACEIAHGLLGGGTCHFESNGLFYCNYGLVDFQIVFFVNYESLNLNLSLHLSTMNIVN